MTIRKFCERLDVELETLIRERSEAVADGAATDFADYKARCAEIRGLKRSRSVIDEQQRRFMDEDDEDD